MPTTDLISPFVVSCAGGLTLNKVEQRAYDNLKRADELNMLNDEQKEQLKKLEEKRKQ